MKTNVLITGASRGLGYAMCENYLKSGCRVFACMRSISGKAVRKLKEQYGEDLLLFEMDVAVSQSVEQAAEKIRQVTSCLDIIINNAAIHSGSSMNNLEQVIAEDCLEVYNVNTLGPLRVAKEFAGLLEGGSMKVLANISSEAGSISTCGKEREFDYCMSKVALNMESVLLQNYLRSRGIKVLALHPGWVRTDMGGKQADFAPEVSAQNVVNVIKDHARDLEGALFLNYDGKSIMF
jgi:NAD(P)-dependent dehydrogenase (short-subunit alcohol dehydrogenase family)